METKEQLTILLNKYLERKCTIEEIRQLLNYFELPHNEKDLKAAIFHYFENADEENQNDSIKENLILQDVHAKLITEISKHSPVPKNKQFKWHQISAAAAVIIILFSISIYQ
jgi:transmembrane sensor